MSSCTDRVLRNDIYIAARRDRRSRDCFDARVIAPSFVETAMDLSAIGPRRHPHHPPKGCRKMRWINFSADANPAAQQLDCKSAPKCALRGQGATVLRCRFKFQLLRPGPLRCRFTLCPCTAHALSQPEEPFLHTPSSEAGLRPSGCCRKGDPRHRRTNRCR